MVGLPVCVLSEAARLYALAVGLQRLVERHGRKHAVAREAPRAWHADASQAQWLSPEDVKRQYPKASVIANNRVVFNIGAHDREPAEDTGLAAAGA